jgi:hypothetical protein
MVTAQNPAAAPQELAAPPVVRHRRRLRNYLLDTRLQLRLASYLAATATVLAAGMSWLLWKAWREASQVLELSDPSVGAALAKALAREDQLRILAVAAALLVVLTCLLCAAVVVTHRIAGPAYAIGRTCRRVGQGDLREPRPLRAGDLLQDLGDEVVGMVGAMREREARERGLVAAAAQVLLDPFAAAQKRQELARQLEQLAADKERRLAP